MRARAPRASTCSTSASAEADATAQEDCAMTSLMDEIVGGGASAGKDPKFPHAPAGWTPAAAADAARREGLQLGDEQWAAVRALQEYYAKHETPGVNMRELHDALDERFHPQGGIRRLYML